MVLHGCETRSLTLTAEYIFKTFSLGFVGSSSIRFKLSNALCLQDRLTTRTVAASKLLASASCKTV